MHGQTKVLDTCRDVWSKEKQRVINKEKLVFLLRLFIPHGASFASQFSYLIKKKKDFQICNSTS